MSGWLVAPLFVLLLWGSVLAVFAAPLWRRWREPVLKFPLLAIESDDWGAGPHAQAALLDRIAACLARHRDGQGRSAVMTLGVILEIPDGAAIRARGTYAARRLADAEFEPVRAAMQRGISSGVFVPHLHGQSHYWPPAVMRAARSDPAVQTWLTTDAPAVTEALPSPLQSRWVDGSCLPSAALADADIAHAARSEAGDFSAVFGHAPAVAVATTFVWNDAVETAWAEAGVRGLVTPGQRATCRDAQGTPGCVDKTLLTGETGRGGLVYLVRDVYFEPAFGHPSERLLDGLRARARQARACWVETHRSNFLQHPDASLATLDTALAACLAGLPGVRFATPAELVRAIRERDPHWLETRFAPRWRALRARADEIPRYRRVARLTGLGWLL